MRLRTVREPCRLGQTYTLYPLGDVYEEIADAIVYLTSGEV
jgi:hypothetical protein